MRFKNNKVYMAVDEAGQPLIEKGKILIKYQLDQPHEYWVFPASVQPLDSVENPAPPSANRKAKKAASPKTTESAPTEQERNSAVLIYTDGACSGNPGPAGVGVVLRYKDNHKKISRHIGQATNNIAELEAIKTGLLAVKNRTLPVIVFTDSSYALGLLTQGWKAKQNIALVAEVKNLASSFKNLRFIKVKGHAGDPDNELADRLAVRAIDGEEV
ncbi:MAG: ribonuclease HI [Desulfobacteraceae bacterium]|nr:ribonuclease HI [Desulfobacteraceae bacterium]